MKKYYIKERHNPQLGVYYVLYGQLTKKDAKNKEKSLYGQNIIISYDTIEDYNKAILTFKEEGHRVQ